MVMSLAPMHISMTTRQQVLSPCVNDHIVPTYLVSGRRTVSPRHTWSRVCTLE